VLLSIHAVRCMLSFVFSLNWCRVSVFFSFLLFCCFSPPFLWGVHCYTSGYKRKKNFSKQLSGWPVKVHWTCDIPDMPEKKAHPSSSASFVTSVALGLLPATCSKLSAVEAPERSCITVATTLIAITDCSGDTRLALWCLAHYEQASINIITIITVIVGIVAVASNTMVIAITTFVMIHPIKRPKASQTDGWQISAVLGGAWAKFMPRWRSWNMRLSKMITNAHPRDVDMRLWHMLSNTST